MRSRAASRLYRVIMSSSARDWDLDHVCWQKIDLNIFWDVSCKIGRRYIISFDVDTIKRM